MFKSETVPVPEAGVRYAAVRLIWKNRTVTPLGGSSVMLRVTCGVEFAVCEFMLLWPHPTSNSTTRPMDRKSDALRILTSLEITYTGAKGVHMRSAPLHTADVGTLKKVANHVPKD